MDYVLHLASPIPTPDLAADVKKHILDPAVKGTVGMLQSAAESKSLKRVVITSSVVVLAPKPGEALVGPDDLAPIPDADKLSADEWVAYRASKILAYHAAQGFMASERTTFDLVNIMPSYVQGRNELATRKEDVHDGSNDVMVDLVLGAKGGRAEGEHSVC